MRADYFSNRKDPKLLLLGTKQKMTHRLSLEIQKQSPRGILEKRCCENMQQIYRRTPMPKCDFDKVALQLCTSTWVISCKFAAYFQNNFSQEHLWVVASGNYLNFFGVKFWHKLKHLLVGVTRRMVLLKFEN